jgi:hypothetical protein
MTDDNVTTPAAEPIVWLKGQPVTRTAAGARRQELMADPEYGKAAAAGDMTKIAELTTLWRVEHGMTPDPPPPATPEEVRASMLDRDAEIDDARIDGYAKYIPFNDEKRATIKRGLATQAQHDEAARELDRMIADPVLRQRIMDGDKDAKERWHAFNLIKALKIAPPDFDWSKP